MAVDVYFHISMRFYMKQLNEDKDANNTNEASKKKFHDNKKAPVLPEANRVI